MTECTCMGPCFCGLADARRAGVSAPARRPDQPPSLLIEHEQWATVFGAALVRALQGDYSNVDALAKNLRIVFPDGSPRLYSRAIEEYDRTGGVSLAHGEGVCQHTPMNPETAPDTSPSLRGGEKQEKS